MTIKYLFQAVTINDYIEDEQRSRPLGVSLKEMVDKAIEFDFGEKIIQEISQSVTNDAGENLNSESTQLAMVGFK